MFQVIDLRPRNQPDPGQTLFNNLLKLQEIDLQNKSIELRERDVKLREKEQKLQDQQREADALNLLQTAITQGIDPASLVSGDVFNQMANANLEAGGATQAALQSTAGAVLESPAVISPVAAAVAGRVAGLQPGETRDLRAERRRADQKSNIMSFGKTDETQQVLGTLWEIYNAAPDVGGPIIQEFLKNNAGLLLGDPDAIYKNLRNEAIALDNKQRRQDYAESVQSWDVRFGNLQLSYYQNLENLDQAKINTKRLMEDYNQTMLLNPIRYGLAQEELTGARIGNAISRVNLDRAEVGLDIDMIQRTRQQIGVISDRLGVHQQRQDINLMDLRIDLTEMDVTEREIFINQLEQSQVGEADVQVALRDLLEDTGMTPEQARDMAKGLGLDGSRAMLSSMIGETLADNRQRADLRLNYLLTAMSPKVEYDPLTGEARTVPGITYDEAISSWKLATGKELTPGEDLQLKVTSLVDTAIRTNPDAFLVKRGRNGEFLGWQNRRDYADVVNTLTEAVNNEIDAMQREQGLPGTVRLISPAEVDIRLRALVGDTENPADPGVINLANLMHNLREQIDEDRESATAAEKAAFRKAEREQKKAEMFDERGRFRSSWMRVTEDYTGRARNQ